MAINSRAKGAAGERELANYLTEKGFPARRGQQFKGTSDSPDIVCERLAEMLFLVECKRVQALNIHKAVTKCKDECEGGQRPVVMHRKNGEEWLATVPIDVFLSLVESMEEPSWLRS